MRPTRANRSLIAEWRLPAACRPALDVPDFDVCSDAFRAAASALDGMTMRSTLTPCD